MVEAPTTFLQETILEKAPQKGVRVMEQIQLDFEGFISHHPQRTGEARGDETPYLPRGEYDEYTPEKVLERIDAAKNEVLKQESPEGYATDYYVLPEGAKELGDLIDYKNMSFNVGNVFKACYRLGEKEGTTKEYDLYKMIYFAQRELERLRKYG